MAAFIGVARSVLCRWRTLSPLVPSPALAAAPTVYRPTARRGVAAARALAARPEVGRHRRGGDRAAAAAGPVTLTEPLTASAFAKLAGLRPGTALHKRASRTSAC